MAATSPALTLNNGVKMPALGLGVLDAGADATAPTVMTALNTGYRLIDTAAYYLPKRGTGRTRHQGR
jgi:diketogulonate reductase-like aldo/keto reductase